MFYNRNGKYVLVYLNPRTVTYGLETSDYKASQLWKNIPEEIQQDEDVCTLAFKHFENICNCNPCKPYVANLGYIDNNSNSQNLTVNTISFVFYCSFKSFCSFVGFKLAIPANKTQA